MKSQVFLFLISAAGFVPARGNPISTAEDIQVQENFDEERFYGKWYDIAIGSTCPWMKKHKDRFIVGTLIVGPGQSSKAISMTTTRLRHGLCSQVISEYQKTDIPGKLSYYNPKWNVNIETFVVHTNYNEYAIFVMKKNSTHGLSTTAKIYGRSPELREDLVAEFRQLALDLGIPEDSIGILINKGECVPSIAEPEPQPRVRRTTLFEEEGSADGPLHTLVGHKEDYCRLLPNAGPCLSSAVRYFYNSSSHTCETFTYGGCLGNGNNFHSEKACLQMCRTEASCRLPIVPGGSCKTTYWAFDASLGKCVTFEGCGSNGNKFYHEKECKEYCGVLSEGRCPEHVVTRFRQVALDLGIPEDSLGILFDKVECVTSTAGQEQQPRVRRTTLFEEEGSADGSLSILVGRKEDYCRLLPNAGPCLGSAVRYFYNSSSHTCETFTYGGCLGNGNNFHSEKACLQTCRTEASCRLPIVPGGSCKTTYWAFDANLGKCVTFEGCGSNGNKFYHEKECKEYCGVLSEGDEEFLHLLPSQTKM